MTKKRRKLIIAAIVLTFMLIIGIGGAYFYLNKQAEDYKQSLTQDFLNQELVDDLEDLSDSQYIVKEDDKKNDDKSTFASVSAWNYQKRSIFNTHLGAKTITKYTTYKSPEKLDQKIAEIDTIISHIEQNEPPMLIKEDVDNLKSELIELKNLLQKYKDYYAYFKKTNTAYILSSREKDSKKGTAKLLNDLRKVKIPDGLDEYHQVQIDYVNTINELNKESERIMNLDPLDMIIAMEKLINETPGTTSLSNDNLDKHPLESFSYERIYTIEDDEHYIETIKQIMELYKLY